VWQRDRGLTVCVVSVQLVGGLWLVALVMLTSVVRKSTRKVAADLGGRKRFTSMSLPFGVAALLPFTIYQWAWVRFIALCFGVSLLSP
jgi:hypothetical protein